MKKSLPVGIGLWSNMFFIRRALQISKSPFCALDSTKGTVINMARKVKNVRRAIVAQRTFFIL